MKTRWELEQEKERRKRANRWETILLIVAVIIALLAVIFVPVPTKGASEVEVEAHDVVSSEIVPDDEEEYYRAVLRAQKPTTDDELASMAGTVIASDTPEEDEADDQFELLCMVVMAEGGNTEPDKGIRYMADGILNRVDDKGFPGSIKDVCYEKHWSKKLNRWCWQFDSVATDAIYKWVPTERVIRICAEEMEKRMNNDVLYWRTGNYHARTTPIEHVGHHYYSGR